MPYVAKTMRKNVILWAGVGGVAVVAASTAYFANRSGGELEESAVAVHGSPKPSTVAVGAASTRIIASRPATSSAPVARATVPPLTRIPVQQRFATRAEVFPDGNLEALDVGDNFTIALFRGVSLAARVTDVTQPGPAARTIVAELPGIPFGRATISRHGDALYASVYGAQRGNFEIRRAGEGLLVKSITAADELACSTEHADADLVDADDVSNEPSPILPELSENVRRKAATGTVQDVPIYFNDQARVTLGGAPGVPTDDADIRAKIQAAVADANVAYADSNVPMTLQAVLVTPIAYVYPPGEDLQRALDELRSPTDGQIDGIHAARDAVQADIVSMWIENDVGGGKANLNLPGSIRFQNAFNIIRARNPTSTFVHEIGHNHGCRHMREGYSSPPIAWAADSFAHFLTTSGGDSFVTVVANNTDQVRTGAMSRILRFSAPELTYLGAPTGVAGDRNNAATVRQTAPMIAAFRGAGGDATPPKVKLKTKRRIKTRRGRVPIRGLANDASGIASVTYRASGLKGEKTARGTNRWKFKVRLKKRRTSVKVFATDFSGLRSRPQKLTVIRTR